MHPKEERTLILVKPDGVKRGLVGEVLRRIEQRGLKIIALKMITPTREQVFKHYPQSEKWLRGMGEKTLEHYRSHGQDPIKELGTDDTFQIGKMVSEWLTEFMTSGPIVACIVEGIHAIEMVRKIVGNTFPAQADMGTIRGDYSVDSPTLANLQKRSIHNVIHASGDLEEARHEIAQWFAKEEMHSYKRAEEDIMF